MATRSSTLALKIPWMEELGAGYYPWGRKESGTTERLHFHFHLRTEGFSGGSDSKESACNAGDPDSIPRQGRSPGKGNGYPLQYSCPENPLDRGAWQVTVHGVAKSWHNESDTTEQLTLALSL